jgi:peptidyl-prolyl cis-trans isomerase C
MSLLSSVKRLSREPLVQFLLIGAVMFAIYGATPAGWSTPPSEREIRLSLDEMTQLIQLFQAQWRRQPSAEELSHMVEDKVKEEVLYREALAKGLDKSDEIVKRRMALKMQFLAEDMAAAHEPTTIELKSWFDKHRDMFALPPRLSFRHLYFSPDKRGTQAREDAAQALVKLTGQPEDSKLAASLADPFMFQDYYRDRAPEYLGKEFGPPFAAALEKLAPGSWQGPIESGFGWHLVFLDTVIPGRVPVFEEIEPDVKTAWMGEQKSLAWQKAYKEIRAKYTVYLPAPADNVNGAAPLSANSNPQSSSTPARRGQ